MSGHVFHPGHDDLHGITVVVEGRSGKRYIGRWHEAGARGVVMHDVAVHDPANAERPWPEYLARVLRFGVHAQHKLLVVPPDEVGRTARLTEFSAT